MAGQQGRKKSSSSGRRSGGSRKNSRSKSRKPSQQDIMLYHEILLIALFLLMVFFFCCNFGIIGPVGNAISGVMFGLFGTMAYVTPILIFIVFVFWFANEGNPAAVRKLISGLVLFLMLGIVFDLISHNAESLMAYSGKELYVSSAESKNGGGVIAGSISYFLQHYLEKIGTILVVILFALISIILLTEKSIVDFLKNSGVRIHDLSEAEKEHRRVVSEQRREQQELRQEQAEHRRELARSRQEMLENKRLEQDENLEKKAELKRQKQEEKENDKILRKDMIARGIDVETGMKPSKNKETISTKHRDDIHEITIENDGQGYDTGITQSVVPAMTTPKVHSAVEAQTDNGYAENIAEQAVEAVQKPVSTIRIHKEGSSEPVSAKPVVNDITAQETTEVVAPKEPVHSEKKAPQTYMFPPISRLQKGVAVAGDSTAELQDIARRLEQTLKNFNVNVTVTDISQGPSVTRYELQPEQGVKVSRIVNLADDIKLNLAATDIRIEAPIPGKAAIGIEVPNKENMPVALRDLLETKDFKEFPSNIAFAVGKDIAGKVIVTDIAKMPHMLIAGATGSGKSVCINTIIMSILYKAHPDDVKMIMIDPKVVELSVYNGIPHLLVPVVTDPKKAAAALHWGVSEMEDRYRKFADFNVRDLKGYNKKIEQMQESGEENVPSKLPQIVIIVDELADLMMVCPGEVEESICRLAQLARAAGIHLIIATQRPSVDVITGLIKANMPSRVAFSVSSGVDSRTILDMNGAEKLLGKGDMLFYPQGYSKPARIQGAFVSDKEVSDVVDFLKNQAIGNVYAEEIEAQIRSIGSSSSSSSGSSSGDSDNDVDELFEKAGRLLIEKESASIGMLQRAFKIGFNRASRIMDQLSEYGVVSEAEGTKPRKIIMGPEQFEQLIEERL